MRFYTTLALLLALTVFANCKPVEDDTPGAAAPVEEKKDTVENIDGAAKPSDESAALSDSPITDPVTSETADAEKRELDTTTTTTTSTTTTTVAPPIPETTTTSTTPPPEGVDDPTVEGSDNNTRTMKATTFHAAILFKTINFYPELNTNMHDINRHHVMTIIAEVFKDYADYKQTVIIKFTNAAGNDKDKTRANIPSEGTIVDFYLRFYSAGNHLAKLTDAIKTGKLGTHDVHPLFIRAYVAEPTGLVCTPDCKVQCYSYCDAGCCHVNIVQNIALPTPSPVEEFIQNQQNALKTGQTTPKPCTNDECKEQDQQQTMIMPMPMSMPAQMPCQGAACSPMMAMMAPQMPCQGAACQPAMPAQMPCQGAGCAPAMPAQMPCRGAACPPAMPAQMPCQGAGCAPPMMPPQMPCQGAGCTPPMMPAQMPCQGAACGPMMAPQMPCQGAACPPMMPMMPPQMPCQGAGCASMMPMMPPAQMCPPSCGQICAPSCPNECCGGSAPKPRAGRR